MSIHGQKMAIFLARLPNAPGSQRVATGVFGDQVVAQLLFFFWDKNLFRLCFIPGAYHSFIFLMVFKKAPFRHLAGRGGDGMQVVLCTGGFSTGGFIRLCYDKISPYSCWPNKKVPDILTKLVLKCVKLN